MVAASAADDAVTEAKPLTLAWWRDRAFERVQRGIAWYIPRSFARALGSDLAGVWGACDVGLPDSGAVVVANHQSWWDGHIAWLTARRYERPLAVLVHEVTLERYPFFRHAGALSPGELRVGVRRAAQGAWLFMFPEGSIGPPGPPARFADGAARIARLADVPVLPMAWRVTLRGAQRPEVYVRCGEPLPSSSSPEEQRSAVAALLERIERDQASARDPEAPMSGYTLWHAGRASSHERVARFARWWGA